MLRLLIRHLCTRLSAVSMASPTPPSTAQPSHARSSSGSSDSGRKKHKPRAAPPPGGWPARSPRAPAQPRTKAAPTPVNPSYFALNLRDDEVASYKAAGVLPLAWLPESSSHDGSAARPLVLHALLCDESPRGLNFLGGKRDPPDTSAEHTAAREFHEESGSQLRLSIADVRALIQANEQPHTCWLSFAKYALFLLPLPESEIDLPSRYAHYLAHRQGFDWDSPASALHWVCRYSKKPMEGVSLRLTRNTGAAASHTPSHCALSRDHYSMRDSVSLEPSCLRLVVPIDRLLLPSCVFILVTVSGS